MPLTFDTLPLTETGADSTHFVVEMKGAAAETGAGAGLTGADLALTPFGTVGAASSDWRAVSAAGGFAVTAPWADAFIRNSTGFAFLWHMRNVGGDGRLVRLAGTSPSAFTFSLYAGTSPILTCSALNLFGSSVSPELSARGDLFPASGEFFILSSVDYTNELAFFGISLGAVQPANLVDFAFYTVSTAPQAPLASTLSLTYANIVGAADSPAFSIKSVTAKKGPSVTLA